MESNDGGYSPEPQESAAEIARKKVLAVYSATMASLKNNPSGTTRKGDHYITPPVPGATYVNPRYDRNRRHITNDAEAAQARNDYEQVFDEFEDESSDTTTPNSTPEYPTDFTPTSAPTYQTSDTTSLLKDAPINQTNVNDEWKQYHSAWQNYYQNYYSEYYSKAAQNYLDSEKLKSERVATGKTQRTRRTKQLVPVFIILTFGLFLLFLQYNRMIFAPIMAYISPDTGDVTTSIEAVDPTITTTVSPEPRLIIPKLNIDVPVAFEIKPDEVDEAMNHGVAQFAVPGADALPGEIGNVVLSGHSAGDIYNSNKYKFVFSGLERLENGDLIYINYNSVRYTYQMTRSEVVEPDDVGALIYPLNKPVLTLITCTPLGTSRYRLLITAEQISPEYDEGSVNQPNTDNPGAEDGDNTDTPDEGTTSDDVNMPANEPSFFENLWNSIFSH